MDHEDSQINDNRGVKPRPVCPICGATFMDGRGLNGHMAGKHGSKYGLNATVDSVVKEVRDLNAKIDSLINELRESRMSQSTHETQEKTPPELLKTLESPKPETARFVEPKSHRNVEGTQLPLE